MASKTDKANGKATGKPESWSKFKRENPGRAGGIDYGKPTPWHKSHGMYLAGQGAVDEVDALAIDMNHKWGTGRLWMRVTADWRLKFDRQSFLFNQALWHGELEDILRESRRMCAAWRKLDALAEEVGAAKLHPQIWEVELIDGRVIAIVRDNEAAEAVDASGRLMEVYTLGEIARLIHAFPSLVKAKQVFPGATVAEVRKKIGSPLDGIAETELPIDAIPF